MSLETERKRRARHRRAVAALHQHRVDPRCTCSSQSENWDEHEHTSGHWCQLFELVASEDPGDRMDREAHGFTYDDDWQDPTVYCRNGCGLRYEDVVAGKIRECSPAPATPNS